MGKYKKLINDTLMFAIGSLGSKLILFLLVPLYTNCLSTAEYGTVELIDTIANLIVPLVSLVIFDAVLRFVLDKTTDKGSVILNALIIFVCGTIITILITPLLGLYDDIADFKWFLSLYVISYMATQITLTYIKAKEMTRLYVILGLSQTLLLAGLNILLLLVFDLNVYGYLTANIFAHLFIACIALVSGNILSDIKRSRFDKKLFFEMVKYSSPLIINNISWWVLQSSNKLLINLFLQSAALGIYSVASKIPALINVIISLFSQAWTISSVKELDSSDSNHFYSTIFDAYTFIVFLACSGFLLILKPFMSIYVGNEFFDAWRYVPLLLCSAVFSAISSFFGSIYGAYKKSVNVMISTFLSAVINIGLNLLLIPQIGIMGASVSTLIAYLFIAIFRLIDSRRYCKFHINIKKIVAESVLICATTIIVTMDVYSYLSSAIAILFILLLNYKTLKTLYSGTISTFRRGKLNEKDRN